MDRFEGLAARPRTGRLGAFWEVIFPSRCLGCGERGSLLCRSCLPTVPWLPAATCPRCARASGQGQPCQRCDAQRLASVRAACSFDGVVRTGVHRLKFQHARYVAPLLAEMVAASLAQRPLQADLVIPVPLSPGRRRQRGYNQSELIAAELARLTGLPAPSGEILARPRDTKPQVGLSGAARRRNLRGAFTCPRPELVADRRCLIVDDVMTTGSTLDACAEPLITAGAGRVMGLVVAREL